MIVTNIQRFSLHDGPGIRTTIFLKGCSLRCPWCSNPENLSSYPEKYYKDGQEGIYGRNYTANELYEEILKDKNFYDLNGGVTFSGGEALLHAEELMPLVKRLKEENITSAVETCLFVPTINLERIIPHIDFFYVDMKILKKDLCKTILKGDLDLYLTNFDLLASMKPFSVRIPVIGNYTDDSDNRDLIIELLKKHKKSILQVDLIKGHNLGESKYKSLGKIVPLYYKVNDESLIEYKEQIERSTELNVYICKI